MNNERQETNYLDFELRINRGKGREYPVSIIDSPAGEAGETMRFPFDELILEKRLLSLQIALLRSGGKRRLVKSVEEQEVQDFGKNLFAALICGEVRSRYDVSLSKAAQQGKGLRLKLRIQSPEMAALPWEFIFDDRQGEYLSLSRKTPIVRYIELSQPVQPLLVTPPLRILGMIAAPLDLCSIDKEREKLRIEKAVEDLEKRGLVQLTWLPGQTWRDMQRAMRSGPWHIFHFIGHGGFDSQKDEGLICLADEHGKNHPLSASKLGMLLANHYPLRLVLLNACEGARGGNRDIFSSSASILVRRGIPAVIAMQYEITDRAAVEFARAFYESLAEGLPIDASVGEARMSISLAIDNTLEWGAPVLYMRSPDGILFSPAQKPGIKKERREAPIIKEKESPPTVISKQDIAPIKEPKQPAPLETPPGAKTSPAAAKPAPVKAAKTQQEQEPHSKPSLEKAPPASFYKQPKSKHRSIFKRPLLYIIIGIIIGITAYLIFKPREEKTGIEGTGNIVTNKAKGEVKKIPAGGKTVKNEGITNTGTDKDKGAVIKGGISKSIGDTNGGVKKEEKEMPADVQKVKNEDINVSQNETDCYEADFGNGVIMVYIPAGEFTMGANDGYDFEKPEHKVYLGAYWIGKYEVTFEQYDKYCDETGKEKPSDEGWGRGKRPVINVSWEDATAYCDWLNKKTGAKFTLPTEAHWEKAARGTDGRKYPWGNTKDKSKCNSLESGLKMTSPVGNKPAGKSPYGCFDMAGNVCEWCSDLYSKIGSDRVLRGGSWDSIALFCRASYRRGYPPASRWNVAGFRLARE